MKIETHIHTAECDPYAQVSARELVRLYHAIGYGGLVITDHYFALSYDWFRDDLLDDTPHRFVERWLRGYYEAKDEGEKQGMTVLLGAEVRLDGSNINDYLVYGLTEEFLYEAPLLNRLGSLRELVAVLPPEACVVQAHPFRNGMTVQEPEHLFGLEVYNGGTEPYRNRMAREFAAHYHKPMLSGSDFHRREHLGRGGIVTERLVTTSADLVALLRSGEYSRIEPEKE